MIEAIQNNISVQKNNKANANKAPANKANANKAPANKVSTPTRVNKFDALTKYQRTHTLEGSYETLAEFLLAAKIADFIRTLPGSSRIFITGDVDFMPEDSDIDGLRDLGRLCYEVLKTKDPYYADFGVRFYFSKKDKCATMQMVNSDKGRTDADSKPLKNEKTFDKPAKKTFDKPAKKTFDKPVKKTFDKPAKKTFDKPKNTIAPIGIDLDDINFPPLAIVKSTNDAVVESTTDAVVVVELVESTDDAVVELVDPVVDAVDDAELVESTNDAVEVAELVESTNDAIDSVEIVEIVDAEAEAEKKAQNKAYWKARREFTKAQKAEARKAKLEWFESTVESTIESTVSLMKPDKPADKPTEKKPTDNKPEKKPTEKKPYKAKVVESVVEAVVDTVKSSNSIAIQLEEAKLAVAEAKLRLLEVKLTRK